MAAVIGIDLGTVFSCVAVLRNGNIDIVASNQGNRTTPSVVAFNENDILVGESAKNQSIINYSNTVFGKYVRRILSQF